MNAVALNHFATRSESHPVTCDDIAAYEAGELIRTGEERFEVQLTEHSALLMPGEIRAHLTDLVHDLDVVVEVSCAVHFEGRDWTVRVVRVLRDGVRVQAPLGLASRIEGWLERERHGEAREIWEVVS